jgi:hypothetical protein
MTRNMHTLNNYAYTEVRDLGPQHLELEAGVGAQFVPFAQGLPDPMPDYNLGVFRTITQLLKVPGAQVEMKSRDLAMRRATFWVTWSA